MTAHTGSGPEDAAARWVARMDADGWSDADEAELEAWFALDARHRGLLLHTQALWMRIGQPAPSFAQEEAPAQRPAVGRRRVLAGGAGALAASLALGFFLWPEGLRYKTAVGEIRRFPLADGSTAAINTASTIEIMLTAKRRGVRIDTGEAWFQVAKDASRPFVVEAGRVRVRAVGTAFSVRRRDGGADVLVTEGVVEAWADGAEGHRVRLVAGSRAFISDDASIREMPVGASSVDRALAWRSGKIDLNGVTLADAVAEFNRYNQRQLRLVDARLGSETFDGVFRTDDPDGFARTVAASLSVPVDSSDPAELRIGAPK